MAIKWSLQDNSHTSSFWAPNQSPTDAMEQASMVPKAAWATTPRCWVSSLRHQRITLCKYAEKLTTHGNAFASRNIARASWTSRTSSVDTWAWEKMSAACLSFARRLSWSRNSSGNWWLPIRAIRLDLQGMGPCLALPAQSPRESWEWPHRRISEEQWQTSKPAFPIPSFLPPTTSIRISFSTRTSRHKLPQRTQCNTSTSSISATSSKTLSTTHSNTYCDLPLFYFSMCINSISLFSCTFTLLDRLCWDFLTVERNSAIFEIKQLKDEILFLLLFMLLWLQEWFLYQNQVRFDRKISSNITPRSWIFLNFTMS